jgi:hypothetical protein
MASVRAQLRIAMGTALASNHSRRLISQVRCQYYIRFFKAKVATFCECATMQIYAGFSARIDLLYDCKLHLMFVER